MPARKTNAQVRNRLIAGAIGLATVALVLVADLLGLLTPLELVSLDARLRYLGRPPVARDQIVVVGIDDPALERWGEWPWDRTRTARLIGVLHELGARAIAVDLLFNRTKSPRVTLPELNPDFDLEPLLSRDADLQVRPASGLAFDDETLAATIARCGNVVLSMDFPIVSASTRRAGASRELVLADLLAARPTALDPAGLAAAYAAAERAAGRAFGEADQARLQHELEQGEDYWAAFRLAAARWAAAALARQPDLAFPDFARQTLEGYPGAAQPDSFARKELGLAFRRQLSLAALQRVVLRPATSPPDWLPGVQPEREAPPLPALVRAAAGVGFVGYDSSFRDNIFRDAPLVVRRPDGTLYPALSLAVAARLYGLYDGAVSFGTAAAGRYIAIAGLPPPARPDREGQGGVSSAPAALPVERIPVNAAGNLLVAWPHARQWKDALPALSVGPFMDLLRNRELIEQNTRVLRQATLAVLDAFGGPKPGARYERVCAALDALAAGVPLETDGLVGFPASQPAADQRAWLQAEAAKLQQQAVKMTAVLGPDLQAALKDASVSGEERIKVKQDLAAVEQLEAARAADREQVELQRQIEQARAELVPLIAGRVVFIGSTATGAVASDLIASPAYAGQTPGVIVHASVFNQLVTGYFLRWPIAWLDVLVLLACGVLTTLAAVRLGPVSAGLASAGLAALLAGAVVIAFLAGQLWLHAAAPLAAIMLCYLTVVTWKLRTEDRQRRLYADYFSQYTDPHLARQIAEDFSLIERVEEREISVFFSDLAGFTSISERLGGQRTQEVLNAYFERMGSVLRPNGAMINKYLGDGIMVFFNPVVNPQPDHALRALRCALECVAEVKRLNGERRAVEPDWPDLKMRVGVNTGRAIVGNLGSKDKTDYTCISDIVNLAARLEPANKVFGTSILVGGATARAVAGEYLSRPLGKLRAVGKEECVEIYEPLGRLADADDKTRRHVELWEQALAHFYARDWGEATTLFLQMRDEYADDAAAGIYLGLCMQYEADPPPEHWQGEYIQTSK